MTEYLSLVNKEHSMTKKTCSNTIVQNILYYADDIIYHPIGKGLSYGSFTRIRGGGGLTTCHSIHL